MIQRSQTPGAARLNRGNFVHTQRRLVMVGAVGLLIFAALLPWAWHGRSRLLFDRWVDARNLSSHPNLVHLGSFLSFFGDTTTVIVLTGVLVLVLWRLRVNTWLVGATAFGVGLSGAAELIGKRVIQRPRPLTAALHGESGFGFPSGHATGAAALATACVLLLYLVPRADRLAAPVKRGLTVVAVLVALGVAVGRVLLGVHESTDVVAGLALGVAVTVFVFVGALAGRHKRERTELIVTIDRYARGPTQDEATRVDADS